MYIARKDGEGLTRAVGFALRSITVQVKSTMQGNKEEHGFREALGSLQHLKFKLTRKINELKALRHLVEDAYDHQQSTEEDWTKLKSELEVLNDLKQNYEAAIDALNDTFAGKQSSQDAMDCANKSFEEGMNAYLNTNVIVGKLLRRIRNQLDFKTNKQSHEPTRQQEAEEHNEEGKGESTTDIDDDGEKDEQDKDEPLTASDYVKTIIGFLIIVFGFYSLLGVVIWQVSKRQAIETNGI